MAAARSTSSPRDHAADANPDRARKKQRLGEDERGTSPDTSILIEADEPEDIGTNFEKAIQIDDDFTISMEPYCETFALSGIRGSALEHLRQLHTDILHNCYLDSTTFFTVAISLENHIKQTASHPTEWKQHYLEDEAEFFAKLAALCHSLLESGDLFDPNEVLDLPLLRQAFQSFMTALQCLCRRILPLLPEAIKATLSRRDSAQVAARMQMLGSLYYINVAQRVLFLDTPLVHFFQNFEKKRVLENIGQHNRAEFYADGMVTSLATVIRTLSAGMRELRDAWPVLLSALDLFKLAIDLCNMTGRYPYEEAEEVLGVLNAAILPAVCGKHPRALPDNFHGWLVVTAAHILCSSAESGDQATMCELYERFVKSETDALIPETSHAEDLQTSLWRVAGEEKHNLANLLSVSWSMQAYISYVRSDIMDIRSIGVTLLKERLVALYSEGKDSVEGFEHPITQYAVRFLRENEVTKYIFGPESRAGLIGPSADIVCFLAATSTYTDAETDIIWRACTTSVEADFVKASFAVLDHVSKFLDFQHLIYITSKFATTPAERLGPDAVNFYDKLLRALRERNQNVVDRSAELTLASTIIKIMKAVCIDSSCPSREELCRISLLAVAQFARPSVQLKDKVEVYKQCIPDIQKHSAYATVSAKILTQFLGARIQPQEAEVVLSMLPVSAAVDELCSFVQDKQRDNMVKASAIDEVIVRLSCIIHLMNLSPTPMDEETTDRLFDHAFGNAALGNPARDLAWKKLNELTDRKSPLPAANSLWQMYTERRVPDLQATFATPTLIGFIGASLKADLTPERIEGKPLTLLSAPLWKALIRIAAGAEEKPVVDSSVGLILDLLFTYPKSTRMPPALIVPCQCEFARDHIRNICDDCERLTHSDQAAAVQRFARGISILNATLMRSKESASVYSAPEQPDILVIDDDDSDGDLILFIAQIYGPNVPPKSIQIQASADTKLSELISKLPPKTAAAENRIIVGGKEVSLQPDQTLREARIPQSGVALICPKYTFHLDLDEVLTSPGPVEEVIISQYETLESFLNGPDEIAQQAFEFLHRVRPSAQARARIISPDSPATDLFPRDKPWRSRLSLAILQQHLSDFVKLGVADQDFISRSIHQLMAVILDATRPFQPVVMLEVARSLLIFFQSNSRDTSADGEGDREMTGDITESQDIVAHLDDQTGYISRMISLIFEAMNVSLDAGYTQDSLSLHTDVTKTLYRALLESCRGHSNLWRLVEKHPAIVELHKRLLLDSDPVLSKEIALCIRDLCCDPQVSQEVPEAYWGALTPSLPYAMLCGNFSDAYFTLLCDILALLSAGEDELRNMIAVFSSELWAYRHTETARLAVTDKVTAGLLRLLGIAVTFLKSLKKPLQLEGLPNQLMRQLLFPPLDDPSSHPLTSEESRGLVYDLVRWTFEPDSDYDELVDVSCAALSMAHREVGFKFPGVADWIRLPWNAAGLYNLGMTCYMNSLLQQLYHNLQFRKFILDQPIYELKKDDVLCQVQYLFASMQHNTSPGINTEGLADALRIQTGNQEDVHTFYTTLLSRLEESMEGNDDKVALANFFTGKSITQIKGDCGHVSSRMEPFTELSITVKNKTGLHESLDEFVQGEPLEGANKYMCMTCESEGGGRLVNAVKRTCLEEVPDNLTFCLKRFTYESMTEGENKVNDRFEFPSAIDMSVYKRSYLEHPDRDREHDIFELVGVIVHQGSLQFGHYWSYVRVLGSNGTASDTWLYLEDNKALHCTGGVEDVQKQCFGGPRWSNGTDRADSAYVLFYQRQSYIAQAENVNVVSKQLQYQHQMLPEVNLPGQISTSIDTENTWRQLRSSFFTIDFSEFVIWLLGQLPTVLSKRNAAQQAADDQAEEGVIAMPSNSRTEAMLGELIAQYATKVLPADPLAESKVDAFMTSLGTVIETSPIIARAILRGLTDPDGFAFANIVRHDHAKVRAQFFAGIESCMSILREHAPQTYERTVQPLIQSHASIVGLPLDNSRGRWHEYLAFAANYAQLGFRETGIILQCNYLAWALDIMFMRQDLELRRAHADLFNWWKLNSLDLSSVFDFVYALLRDHVDLSETPHNLSTGMVPRASTPKGWCLLEEEYSQLLRQRDTNSGKIWSALFSGSSSCRSKTSWEEYAPGKLLGLLVSDKSHPMIVRFLDESTHLYIEYEEDKLMPVIFTALHYCANRPDDACKGLIRHLSKNLMHWIGYEKDSLWFFEQAYPLAPISVVHSMPHWAAHLLAMKKTLSRQKAAVFLRDRLFKPSAFSDNSGLDVARVRVARALVGQLQRIVQDAYNGEQGRGPYEAMMETLQHAKTYMTKLRDAVTQAEEEGQNVAQEIRVECDESRATLAGLLRILNDLKDWEPETALPTRPLDVRKSVEVESDGVDTSDAELDELSSDVETV